MRTRVRLRVKQIMDQTVAVCRSEDTLDDAISRMWESSCSILPVEDHAHSLLGTISERDICLALHLENARPLELTVGEAMNARRLACSPDDSAESALQIMKRNKIRSIPVVDFAGRVIGMIAADDVETSLRALEEHRPTGQLGRAA